MKKCTLENKVVAYNTQKRHRSSATHFRRYLAFIEKKNIKKAYL